MSPEVPIIVLTLAIPTYYIIKSLITRLTVDSKRNRKFLAINNHYYFKSDYLFWTCNDLDFLNCILFHKCFRQK